ncbi:Ubiquinone biosynthesis O-methyltransferase [compost metagenome]
MSPESKVAGHETLERISDALGRYNVWMYEQIAAAVGEEVLEVGSGIGNLSIFLQGRRRVCLTDLSPAYLEILQKRFGHQPQISVHAWDLGREAPAVLEPRSFDTVICLNVLEHIADDRAALHRMRALLKPGGRLALLVPAHAWLYNGFDKTLEHHRRYSKPGLTRLLAESGFRTQRSWYFNALGALGWFVNGKLLRKTLLPSGQMKLFDLLVPLLKLERWIPLPLGISVIAIAEALPEPKER